MSLVNAKVLIAFLLTFIKNQTTSAYIPELMKQLISIEKNHL